MSETIIVVDDDPQLTDMLKRYLSKEGYEVVCVATANEFARVLQERSFDLCVLDLMLPDRDGFELTRELRRKSQMPIIVLTARTEMVDRVVGLELGADDYVTKPFEARELLARIKAVLRRSRILKEKSTTSMLRLRFGSWFLDLSSRTLTRDGTGAPIPLTSMEYALIKVLAENTGSVFSRDQLLDLVHGSGVFVADRAIDVHIARIRRKIERNPAEPEFIRTVRGKGYVLVGVTSG